MTIWQLALLAKEVERLSDDGLVSISRIGCAEVHLESRAFNELFPACWYEKRMDERHIKRAIKIDGVEYSTVIDTWAGE